MIYVEVLAHLSVDFFWKIVNTDRICFLKLYLDGLENLRQN